MHTSDTVPTYEDEHTEGGRTNVSLVSSFYELCQGVTQRHTRIQMNKLWSYYLINI